VEFLIFMALTLVVLYVLLIRPQRQRQRDHQSMIDSAGVDEDVLTTGGIYGTVVEAEGDDLVVEIADGVRVHMTRRGIAAVLPPEDEEDEEEPLGDEDVEDEVVEVEDEVVEVEDEGEAVDETETSVR
jgi:preprotein translocase subunit YajC